MAQVFGENQEGLDAIVWRCYWTALTTYCEERENGDFTRDKPRVHFFIQLLMDPTSPFIVPFFKPLQNITFISCHSNL